ncbi:MAG: class I SAM-dependent methyltransferase [Holosporales bacterium]|nr:class I SAM-dependent methyltransferase [Holosporales bacterium]
MREHGGSLESVTMQSKEVALARDVREYEAIFNKFNISKASKIIDLGCGIGRWAKWFCDKIFRYDGIDFSRECIKTAKQKFNDEAGFRFYCWDLCNISNFAEFEKAGYDLCIVNGTFMYLNDSKLERVLGFLPSIMASNSQIYIRESVSIVGDRLTLKDFYSSELGNTYNAIYRTDSEYFRLFNMAFNPIDFCLQESALLLDETLNSRKETSQKYYLFAKNIR